jgi:hypothetical protein
MPVYAAHLRSIIQKGISQPSNYERPLEGFHVIVDAGAWVRARVRLPAAVSWQPATPGRALKGTDGSHVSRRADDLLGLRVCSAAERCVAGAPTMMQSLASMLQL